MRIPHDIKARRTLQDVWPQPADLDVLEAAGVVAADEAVYVTAAFAADEDGYRRGEPVPGVHAEVYAWGGAALVSWPSVRPTSRRATLAMRQALARAQLIADLANDIAAGRLTPPLELQGGDYVTSVITDGLVGEVAAELERSWGLAHCSEATAPVLPQGLARQLAMHALHRYHVIRQRDGADPLA
jgi:hypothetical protein